MNDSGRFIPDSLDHHSAIQLHVPGKILNDSPIMIGPFIIVVVLDNVAWFGPFKFWAHLVMAKHWTASSIRVDEAITLFRA
jgi:hypothetical protein